MPGPRPALCTFPDEFLQEARDTVRRRTVAVQTVQRFRLALRLHDHPSLTSDEVGPDGKTTYGIITRHKIRAVTAAELTDFMSFEQFDKEEEAIRPTKKD